MSACTVPEQQLVPPQFTKNLDNITAADGREVTMSCIVAGTPTPEISWYHNHKNIDASEDFVINYDRTTGRVELVIVDCLPDDQVGCTTGVLHMQNTECSPFITDRDHHVIYCL